MATPTIMITVAGKAGSGKSTIAYQIKRLLMGYGFPVEHQERELCSHAVFKRMNNPLDILLAMKQRGTKIIINEQQLNREGVFLATPIPAKPVRKTAAKNKRSKK